MLQLLQPHVIRNLWQLLDAHRSQIVARVPSERLVARMPVAIGESRAGALETLDQSWNIVRRGELEEEVDVIGNDANFDDAGAVALCLGKQERLEEGCDRLVDQWQAGPAGP